MVWLEWINRGPKTPIGWEGGQDDPDNICQTQKNKEKQHTNKNETQVEANLEHCDGQIELEVEKYWQSSCNVYLAVCTRFFVHPLESISLLYIMLTIQYTLVEFILHSHYEDGSFFVWTQQVAICIKFALSDRAGQMNSHTPHFGRAPWTHNGRERGSHSPQGPVAL